MEPRALPLTRRLSTLEVLDAAIWFARDHCAAWLVTAGAGGLAFAVALAAFYNAITHAPKGMSVEDFFVRVAMYSAGLSVLFVARGLGQWAAVEFLRARIFGESRSPEGSWLPALRHAPAALFFCGFSGMCQWAGLAAAVYPGLATVNSGGLALSAAVFERLDPAAALRRSRALMKGSFAGAGLWGLLLAVWALLFVNVLMFGAFGPEIARSLFGLSLPHLERLLSPDNPVFVALSLGFTWALTDALRTVAFAVLYLNARIEKEGSDLLQRMVLLRAGRRPREEAAHV